MLNISHCEKKNNFSWQDLEFLKILLEFFSAWFFSALSFFFGIAKKAWSNTQEIENEANCYLRHFREPNMNLVAEFRQIAFTVC